jgi:hypothetical protein
MPSAYTANFQQVQWSEPPSNKAQHEWLLLPYGYLSVLGGYEKQEQTTDSGPPGMAVIMVVLDS